MNESNDNVKKSQDNKRKEKLQRKYINIIDKTI